eukprot:TRINITY_DN84_c0_g1_i1.p2 TRINITY_DN84_c0_g1~~TRINITY_DN84_c0_g1_i1.p2  ORF type:complete len:160 (+),score=29.28 TRINITY_DN84_c0_g1_i1:227-706(+)
MFLWWFTSGLLVVLLTLVALVLFPQPNGVRSHILLYIEVLKKFFYLVLLGLTWQLFDATLELQRYSLMQTPGATGPGMGGIADAAPGSGQLTFLNHKARADCNFYMTAFAWTMLVVLLRVHWLSKRLVEAETGKPAVPVEMKAGGLSVPMQTADGKKIA